MILSRNTRSWALTALSTLLMVFILYYYGGYSSEPLPPEFQEEQATKPSPVANKLPVIETYLVHDATPTLSKPPLQKVPVETPISKPGRTLKIQHAFTDQEIKEVADSQNERREAVKKAFQHAWSGYKSHAWLKDEVKPISGESHSSFGGLAATLVDSLDSLWILGFQDEFEAAVKAISAIDFRKPRTDKVSLFEYTIRYLGGLLGAFEISDGKYPVLLEKAIEMGDLLYMAFDTPNGLPLTYLEWNVTGVSIIASENTAVAELGSLSLEFTTLSKWSKNEKYSNAIQRITDALQKGQNTTQLPGMWPTFVDAKTPSFSGHNAFTLGAMSDSLYEYLPKQHLLMNSSNTQYLDMYKDALDQIKKNLLFRPMTRENDDILLSGQFHMRGSGQLEYMVQHLGCFAGGMIALGAMIMQNEDDLVLGRKLTDGCIWAYNSTKSGAMPEVFHVTECGTPCEWNESEWYSAVARQWKAAPGDNRSPHERGVAKVQDERLSEGFTKIDDRRYILRPEAIESVFYLYRITGDPILLDHAWDMFTAITNISQTAIANAAVNDVSVSDPKKTDRMESFWLAETLKYFYLIFSDPSVVSLDDYVLNTEAHPFKIHGT